MGFDLQFGGLRFDHEATGVKLMKLILHAEHDIELLEGEAPGFEVESEDPAVAFSAIQMFATSLALCSFSVLYSYAEQLQTPADALRIRVRWAYAQEPLRISRILMHIQWPGLPPSRQKAAERAASQCTLHHTLEQPPEVITQVHN